MCDRVVAALQEAANGLDDEAARAGLLGAPLPDGLTEPVVRWMAGVLRDVAARAGSGQGAA